MTSIKTLLKQIKETLAAGENSLLIEGMPVLQLTNDYVMVNNFKELKGCVEFLIYLMDVGNCNYFCNRLDVYYKNGKRALTIWIK